MSSCCISSYVGIYATFSCLKYKSVLSRLSLLIRHSLSDCSFFCCCFLQRPIDKRDFSTVVSMLRQSLVRHSALSSCVVCSSSRLSANRGKSDPEGGGEGPKHGDDLQRHRHSDSDRHVAQGPDAGRRVRPATEDTGYR